MRRMIEAMRSVLEVHRAEVAVNENSVLRLEVELSGFLGLELDDEEVVVAVVEQEVVALVDEGGIERLLAVSVQTVVGEVHHVFHTHQFGADIFHYV